MTIKQKLVIDKELTNNIQIICRDETGVASASNPNGYGGDNGSPTSMIDKYIFDLCNLSTGEKYRQIQSNDVTNPNEYNNPDVRLIANKQNVDIHSSNFELKQFVDGLYKLQMTVKLNSLFYGDGFMGTNVIVNVAGADSVYENYKKIVSGNHIYDIVSISDTTLILDRNIEEPFDRFVGGLATSNNFILSQNLEGCLNLGIANLSNDSCCGSNDKDINLLSEVQLYLWGCQRCIDANDIIQATSYFNMANKLVSKFKW